jgi:hypothetical protein
MTDAQTAKRLQDIKDAKDAKDAIKIFAWFTQNSITRKCDAKFLMCLPGARCADQIMLYLCAFDSTLIS